ncbi:MAG: plastocyanin/azurin family copper-binding protein [Patescibacteria group bacterium]
MKTSTLTWIVVVVILVLGVGWYMFAQTGAPATVDTVESGMPLPGSDIPETSAIQDAPMAAGITYGDSGFSPAEVTIKKGGTVTWTNEGGGSMWVASAQHPTHTVYSGTALSQHCPDAANTTFDQCKTGTTYSFTFDKAGTWAYHNHSNASNFGRVIVVE